MDSKNKTKQKPVIHMSAIDSTHGWLSSCVLATTGNLKIMFQ